MELGLALEDCPDWIALDWSDNCDRPNCTALDETQCSRYVLGIPTRNDQKFIRALPRDSRPIGEFHYVIGDRTAADNDLAVTEQEDDA